jgi:hypothetical protein
MHVKLFPIVVPALSFAGLPSTMNASRNTLACPSAHVPDMRKRPLSASPPETFFWIRGNVLP